jgi:hypothetical protein
MRGETMDQVTLDILTRAETAKRERRKREDRGQKFRAEPEVKELIQNTRLKLKEIQAAVNDCDELFQRAEALGARRFCLDWMDDYERNKSKLLSIPSALEWIQNLSEADFNHYSNGYFWPSVVHDFILEFLTDRNGDGRGVARAIREKAGLLEDWVKRNPEKIGAENSGVPPVFPGPKDPPHRVLSPLDDEP